MLRAVIMSIISITASIIHRKQDTLNSIAISAFLILLFNTYSLFNLGFQLSFLGTLGIVLFNSRINFKLTEYSYHPIKCIEGNNSLFSKIIPNKRINKILDLISVSISANILIFPIIIYNYNKISIIFLISNLLVTPILAVLIFSGFLVPICALISNKIAIIPASIFNFMIECFKKIAEISSVIDFSKITVGTPNIITIVLIYVAILIFSISKKTKIRLIFITITIVYVCTTIILKYNRPFTIRFVDVGQGDCTLIITDTDKRILIDGGGSETGSYDVGEKVVVPYLLDRQIRRIDYMIFSHFDSDHCLGLFTVMEQLTVKNAVISEQSKDSANYQHFCKIAKEKRINVIKVQAGNRMKIDKSTYIDILWPTTEQLSQNPLNNNSIVCKLVYGNVSVLFTGDIEVPAEQELVALYGRKLKSDILKAAHHGSITSSTEEFLNNVKPRVALIGVGKNNKFNHPSEEVIARLNKLRYKDF